MRKTSSSGSVHLLKVLVSETGLSYLVETLATHVLYIETPFAAKWDAAQNVGTKPAAYNASAPLSASCFVSGPCLALFAAIGAFDVLWRAFLVHSRHTFISF